MQNWSNAGAGEGRRRSQRVILSIPVTITGEGVKGPFTEKTQTLVINAHGALVALWPRREFQWAMKLQIKSATNPTPQACTVVYCGPIVDGRTQFGVEFTTANPYFWQIAFPPEDWSAVPDEPVRPGAPAGPRQLRKQLRKDRRAAKACIEIAGSQQIPAKKFGKYLRSRSRKSTSRNQLRRSPGRNYGAIVSSTRAVPIGGGASASISTGVRAASCASHSVKCTSIWRPCSATRTSMRLALKVPAATVTWPSPLGCAVTSY